LIGLENIYNFEFLHHWNVFALFEVFFKSVEKSKLMILSQYFLRVKVTDTGLKYCTDTIDNSDLVWLNLKQILKNFVKLSSF